MGTSVIYSPIPPPSLEKKQWIMLINVWMDTEQVLSYKTLCTSVIYIPMSPPFFYGKKQWIMLITIWMDIEQVFKLTRVQNFGYQCNLQTNVPSLPWKKKQWIMLITVWMNIEQVFKLQNFGYQCNLQSNVPSLPVKYTLSCCRISNIAFWFCMTTTEN